MKEVLVLHIILFFCSVVSVHLVSWVGSVVHSVPNSADSGYAVFTFRSDQDKPMSTNLMMNVLFPNVFLILIHLVCYNFNIPYKSEHLIFYVPYYYLYRLMLICIFLRRKELYSIGYEITNITLGILTSIFLTRLILVDPSKAFIQIPEMISEFWLIIFLLVYKFIVLLLDKIFNQKTIVGEHRLNRYICKRFNYFYDKFENLTDIGEYDGFVWVLLYSIMIFEDYNRGSLVRVLERIKILFHHKATVGIMQIKSEHNLSDEESIIKAYNLLRFDIIQGASEIEDEMQIEHYAFQYNPDEDYSKSVAFIYKHLHAYIKGNPKYNRKFHLDSQPITEAPSNEDVISHVSLEDLAQMTELTKEEIYERIKRENMTVILIEDEVKSAFGIHYTE